MNERIRELAKQSLPAFYLTNCPSALDKFAELIVRECQFAIVSRTDLPKHERKLYNNVLKEHFGVKE
jgi:hypothetical protein